MKKVILLIGLILPAFIIAEQLSISSGVIPEGSKFTWLANSSFMELDDIDMIPISVQYRHQFSNILFFNNTIEILVSNYPEWNSASQKSFQVSYMTGLSIQFEFLRILFLEAQMNLGVGVNPISTPEIGDATLPFIMADPRLIFGFLFSPSSSISFGLSRRVHYFFEYGYQDHEALRISWSLNFDV